MMYHHETVREDSGQNVRPATSRLLTSSIAICLALAMLLACTPCSYHSTAADTAPLASLHPTAAAVPASPSPSPAASASASTAIAQTPSPMLQTVAANMSTAPKAALISTKKIVPSPKPKPAPRITACRTARPSPSPVLAASGLAAKESMMIGMVNGERKKAGLKPLVYDKGLRAAALKHSLDMLEHNYFDHTSPIYGTFQQRLAASGVKYSTAGENIAYYASVEEAHVGLMNSPGHRANILNTAYTRIGIGIVYDKSKGMYYITQWFAG